METDYFNNLIKNNLFKIFLFGIVLAQMIIKPLRPVYFLLFLVVFIIYLSVPQTENFSESSIEEKINQIDPTKLSYSYRYDIIKIDELAHKLVYLCNNYKNINQAIKLKLVDIYGEIKENDELKAYLKLMNLVDDNGIPLFINEAPDVSLFNQVKILLVTLPKSN